MSTQTIPEAAQLQHIAVLGKTGSGKTWAGKTIVEPWLAARRRVVVVDPTSAWWGLRSSRDGRGPGFPILVLGGDHGDLPLPARGGEAVARLATTQGVSLIADTSKLTVGERTRWFIDFAGALYRENRGPLHLVIDEAHNFAPQGKVPDPDTGRMLHAANTLASGGRSRGIRLLMITQRPQKLHKDALTSADTLIAMRLLAPHDRLAVEDWIKGCGDVAQGKEVLGSLASLQRGEGWVWYPEGGFLQRIRFPDIVTFDSSATPVDGDTIATPKSMAEIDLAEIGAAMADAVKESEANDPKLLRARIAELEREAKKPRELAVDRDALLEEYTRGHAEGWRAAHAAVASCVDRLRMAGVEFAERLSEKVIGIERELEQIGRSETALKKDEGQGGDVPNPSSGHQQRREVRSFQSAPRGPAAKVQEQPKPTGGAAPSRAQQRILESLAMLESMGIGQPSRTQLALWADVSPTSGGYFNNLGALRSAGLIDYPAGGTVELTDAGRDRAPAPTPLSVPEMQDALCTKVGNAKAAILRALISIYPREITRDALAGKIGVSPTSGGYFNNLGALRTLGVIDYPSPGRVVALPVLFLQ